MWSPRVIALKLTKISHSVGHKIPLCHLKGLHFLCGRFRFSSANNCDAEQRFMSSEPKKIRIDEMTIKKIGTHNGTFHCDEVLACFLLRQLPEYAVGTANDREETVLFKVSYLLFSVYAPRCHQEALWYR